MTLFYATASALVGAYFSDEPDHPALHDLLLTGDSPVVTSELTRIELAGAVATTRQAGRLPQAQAVLDRFDADCGDEGVLTLLRFVPEQVLPLAHRLVVEHPLRTLAAIHLAVALTDAVDVAAGDEVTLVTRDPDQAAAARAAGLTTA